MRGEFRFEEKVRWLENKVPPLLLGAIIGVLMWGLARVTLRVEVDLALRIGLALTFVALGIAIVLLGGMAFRKAGTTVNPMKPESTSSLVMVSVYRYTRNPMYVGFTLVLVGWAAFLAAPWTLAGPALFVVYIDRFQILPEERFLGEKFGAEWSQYQQKVRRWL
jgi:protein-S-isoprenylcysteine O-methyltransferase Ste14